MLILPNTVITDQGSSDEGILAEDSEIPVIAAVFVLREAIYAFPNGSTRDEYRQWVQKMAEISKNAFTRAKAIAGGDDKRGLRFVPWVLHRFKQLYKKYQSDYLSFDLRSILVFDRWDRTKRVLQSNVRICYDEPEFDLDLQWMSELVNLWNTARAEKGWPLLTLDDAPYAGRYLGLPGSVAGRGDHVFMPYADRPIWPEKEPVDDPVVRLQPVSVPVIQPEPLSVSNDKGKMVDRLGGDPSDTTEDVYLIDTGVIEIMSTPSISPPPTPTPCCAHPQTPSEDPAPQVASASSSVAPTSPTVYADNATTLNVTPTIQIITFVPVVPEEVMTATSTDADGNEETVVVLKNVVHGGVRMTRDGIYLLPPEDERNTTPSRCVLNYTSSILWIGPKTIHYLFWAHIPKDANLDVLQQALVPCATCAKYMFPCYRLLGISASCVRCRHTKTHCSQSCRFNESPVPNPYNRLLGRYMLCWQIHRFMHNEDLILVYPNLGGYNFMPGVRRGYIPGHRSGNRGETNGIAASCYNALTEYADWDVHWVGENYIDARGRWHNFSVPDLQAGILANTPFPGQLLPSDINVTLKKYYDEMATTDRLFKLQPYDTDILPTADTIAPMTDDAEMLLADNAAAPAAAIDLPTHDTVDDPVDDIADVPAVDIPAVDAADAPVVDTVDVIHTVGVTVVDAADVSVVAVNVVGDDAVDVTLPNDDTITLSVDDATASNSNHVALTAPDTFTRMLMNVATAPTAPTAIADTSSAVNAIGPSGLDRLQPDAPNASLASIQSAAVTRLDISTGENDGSEDAEGSIDDGEDGEILRLPMTSRALYVAENGAEKDVEMTDVQSVLDPTGDDVDTNMLIDDHLPLPYAGSDSNDDIAQAHQDGFLHPSLLPNRRLLPRITTSPRSWGRVHMTSPLPPSHPHHTSGSILDAPDVPNSATRKDKVTVQNLSLITGQLADLPPGYPVGHQQPVPTPSVSERTVDTRTLDTPSNPSPQPFLPVLAEEMGEIRDTLYEVMARIENIETRHSQLVTKLASVQQESIANKAQISLLSSQATNRNDEALSRISKELQELRSTEVSMIRNVITSSVGHALRSALQTHSNTHMSPPPFDSGHSPSAASPQHLDNQLFYDGQVEPPADSIFTAMLTDTILASSSVSPIAPHHPTNFAHTAESPHLDLE